MITISSKAGQRLARAKAACDHIPENGKGPIEHMKQRRDFIRAAEALADELIAGKHHLVEGD